MSKERRRTRRHPDSFPVTVEAVSSPSLTGETVNFSPHGVLLTASGSLHVEVTIKGRAYAGRLVRALPSDDGTTSYAVELEEELRTAER